MRGSRRWSSWAKLLRTNHRTTAFRYVWSLLIQNICQDIWDKSKKTWLFSSRRLLRVTRWVVIIIHIWLAPNCEKRMKVSWCHQIQITASRPFARCLTVACNHSRCSSTNLKLYRPKPFKVRVEAIMQILNRMTTRPSKFRMKWLTDHLSTTTHNIR